MRCWFFVLALILLSASAFSQTGEPLQPERGSTKNTETREPVTARRFMVVAANPHAAEAGREVLRRGGNAIDAMVAVQLVLGLVEPQYSGLGGGGVLVYWDANQRQLKTLDGRETAPMHATPRLFQDKAGQPLEFYDAASAPDVALAIATGEQRIYANILLTIGVIPPPGGKL